MKVVILGSGPMSCETTCAVTAPGARTWQIVQTAALAYAASDIPGEIVVFGLVPDDSDRAGLQQRITVPDLPTAPPIDYVSLPYERFITLADDPAEWAGMLGGVDCVIGCASLQPCATAADISARLKVPFWADIFGDPIAELQSRAELHAAEADANITMYHHAWKLLLSVLLQADSLSGLSRRQRFAIIGQLGAAGRLNHLTSTEDMVHSIPFGLFPSDAPPVEDSPPANFTVMWCGSFNTWMDVDTLVQGLSLAKRTVEDMQLLVLGGRISGYNDAAYDRFVSLLAEAGLDECAELLEWKPLEEVRRLYSRCDVGLSIDRYTYEAVLGSRTRLVSFLAAERPVISTVVTELASDLATRGFVIPFEIGSPESLASAIVSAAEDRARLRESGARARAHVLEQYAGGRVGVPLMDWLRDPTSAADKGAEIETNPLTAYWKRLSGR